ncbi:MAG: NAD-dependent epimerase/dehydratase family protein [Micrococcales bacterium]|nr:NAD-dependent epimerase/dehydratase family protein [Micrococcales bacterium]MCL2668517.1 NAD-dependent epimerase/dehydratase family protein [Micrococcales bacterium]
MTLGGTCVVTGGAGFVGTALSASLADTFEQVVAVDNLLPQIHPQQVRPAGLDPRVELRVADICDPATWDDLLATVHPEVVVHLAAETATGLSLTMASQHTATNVAGTAQMLDALARHQAVPRRVVLASSRAVYGEGAWRGGDGRLVYPAQRTAASLADGQWDYPQMEPVAMDASSVEPRPVSVYGVTKLAQENLVTVWARSFGAQPVVLRLQNVYGPGQSPHNPYTGILVLFCRIAAEGRAIPLYEDGQVRRDFVLVDDVVDALHRAVVTDGVVDRPLDIGSGEHQTIATAARLVAERYGAPQPQVTGQFREGDVRHAWAQVTAASDVLGWSARYDLAAGVARLTDWMDTQDLD